MVENGGFTRAAAVLETDNSAVSRSVKRLEAKLGVTLLNRTTRQISTTEEGAQYFRRAKKILEDMAQAEAEIRAASGVLQGLLRVDAARAGVEPPCAAYRGVLPPLSAGRRVADLV